MDPITFILGIASTVLSSVIVDLVTGKKKAARQDEINKDIADQVLNSFKHQSGGLKPQDLDRIRRIVLEEVLVLATQNPNFVISEGEIALKTPLKKPLLPIRHEEHIQQALQAQLNQLNEVVKQRRQAYGLTGPSPVVAPPAMAGSPEIAARTKIASTDSPVVTWRQVGAKEARSQGSSTQWVQELEERIRRRRSGEES